MSISERNTGLDLFRLLSMFLVVMIHITGGMPGAACSIFASMSICAVDCFGILSGYVGYRSRHRVSGLLGLWLQVVYWYAIINCVGLWLFPDKISMHGLWKSFFPVLTNGYWYFTAFFCVFWCMPALDYIVDNLERSRLRMCLFAVGTLFCLTSFSPFRHLGEMFGSGEVVGYPLGYCAPWLGYLYLVGAYLRKYPHYSTGKMVLVVGYLLCASIEKLNARLEQVNARQVEKACI